MNFSFGSAWSERSYPRRETRREWFVPLTGRSKSTRGHWNHEILGGTRSFRSTTGQLYPSATAAQPVRILFFPLFSLVCFLLFRFRFFLIFCLSFLFSFCFPLFVLIFNFRTEIFALRRHAKGLQVKFVSFFRELRALYDGGW